MLFILLLGFALTLSVRLNRGGGETEKTCREFSPVISTVLVSMTVAGQSWRLLPESCSARIIVISSWIMGLCKTHSNGQILYGCSYLSGRVKQANVVDLLTNGNLHMCYSISMVAVILLSGSVKIPCSIRKLVSPEHDGALLLSARYPD